MAVGAIVKKRLEREQEALLAGAYRFTSLVGTRVVVVEKDSPSDLAEAIGDGADLVIGFSYRAQEGSPAMKVSLRARGGYDCRRFARLFGGGGHVGAASFVLDLTKVTFVRLENGEEGGIVPEIQSLPYISRRSSYLDPYSVARGLVNVAEFYVGAGHVLP